MVSKEQTRRISEAMAILADLAVSLGITNIKDLPACWEYDIDEHWFVAVNANTTVKKTIKGVEVMPYHCYVEFNGWPAAIFNAFGGEFCAGSLANENTFIEAIQKRLDNTLKGANQ